MAKPVTQYLFLSKNVEISYFCFPKKPALENSSPNMQNASAFRAVFSSHRHSYTSSPPFHLSTWLTENRQAIKNTSTSNHGDNVAHYSLALSQRFWHSSGRKRRGEGKDLNGGWAQDQERNWNLKREPLLLHHKMGYSQASQASRNYCIAWAGYLKNPGFGHFCCVFSK